jgi:two-component system OmpR family sensor kinase
VSAKPGARPHSLRTRLLRLLLAAIVLTAVVQALIAYRSARADADQIFDYQMQQTALSLRAGLPVGATGRALAESEGADHTDFVIQVWTADGLLVFESAARAALPQRAVMGFSDVQARGTTYRVFSMQTRSQVIQVAQDMAARRALAGDLALRTAAPIAVMAPLLMLVAWWVVTRSLVPVSRVRRQVAERQADDLSEVSEAGLPDEIRPLVHELNLLFVRLRRAFDAQKSFVADAAHELRSPLAALKLQVLGLQRAADEATRDVAVRRVSEGIDRATRLVEQLLVLARHQANVAEGIAPEQVSLSAIARRALADAAPAAHARRIDLGLGHADEGPHVDRISGHADALRILMRNLIDNAVKYTPEGGTVDLEIVRSADKLTLSVQDSGPGIAPGDRERVQERFTRVAGTQTAGSGLGLAIVRSVAELHGATLRLDRSHRLGGLLAEVTFPAPG